MAPICWPPCPAQRLVWRPIEWCHRPTWRCLPLPMTHRIRTSYTPPYAMPIPRSQRLSSKRKTHSVNNLTHLTKVVGSMAPALPLPLLIYPLLRRKPFRLALTLFCPNHLTYPRPLRIQLLRSEQRKHSMVQSIPLLAIHNRNNCLPTVIALLAIARASPQLFPPTVVLPTPPSAAFLSAINSSPPFQQKTPGTPMQPTLRR